MRSSVVELQGFACLFVHNSHEARLCGLVTVGTAGNDEGLGFVYAVLQFSVDSAASDILSTEVDGGGRSYAYALPDMLSTDKIKYGQ